MIRPYDVVIIQTPSIKEFAMILDAVADNAENDVLSTYGALWMLDIPMYMYDSDGTMIDAMAPWVDAPVDDMSANDGNGSTLTMEWG